ncbi:transcriptional regulator [Phocoenobacter skyensis]|uniref:Putative antitoxin of toxin-antitoxin system, YdaS/YdaT n=1 Tax=Phocoenobacter skyensis TaxID=97481 RepID=A0A1H7V7R3_9PAST|nr:helix-turn-helix domain-containing protein [Pasteurella skyensis]QLB23339.1 transcriptional regulator [Pasteurella skyensis]SEM05312.1 Putative antitoxin of toxin-antitoxin system, YdaS/YdaT [Pasteurella skyensis]
MTLKDYLNNKGRGSLAGFAKALNVKSSNLSFWVSNTRQVPAEYCPEIEKLTKGQVRCEELRPDIDWSVLRNSK